MCSRVFLAQLLLLGLHLLSPAYGQEDVYEEGREVASVDEHAANLTREDQERSRLAALEAELEQQLRLAEGEGEGAIPGEPEQDYPVYTRVPRTSFSCADKHVPGYYADTEARCQAFHICDAGGTKHSFLCPGGSVFNQKYLVCDWWYGFICDEAPHLFSHQLDLARLYQREDRHQSHHKVATNQVFATGAEQHNYIFIPNDIFDGAETGVPNRDRVEHLKENLNQDNKREEKRPEQHSSSQQQSSSSHQATQSNNSSLEYINGKELSSNEGNTFRSENRRLIKNVAKKKHHNERHDQKTVKDQHSSRDNVDNRSTTENEFRDEHSTPFSYEYSQNVNNQPISYSTTPTNEYFSGVFTRS